MSVAIPVCHKDIDRCFSLLGLIRELGGCPRNNCVFIFDCKLPYTDRERLLSGAKDSFESVRGVLTPHSLKDETWPRGANWMFQTACRYFYEQVGTPFLWLEPDCTPMIAGWLHRLETEYKNGGKPFMGPSVNDRHLAGISIYPYDALKHYQAFFRTDQNTAWDYAVDARPLSKITKQIQHFWGKLELPPHFVKERSSNDPENHVLPTLVQADTVLFHRDKDASLTKLVAESHRDVKLDCALVMLGRYGDIYNVLPIAQRISKSGINVTFVVSNEFASILHGVEYVEPMVVNTHYSNIADVLDTLRPLFHHILPAQVWGNNYKCPQMCDSFTREQWRMAGFLDKFNDKTLRLTFDNRNTKREKSLLDLVNLQDKPRLLYSLNSGHSSPFKSGPEIESMLRNSMQGWQCVNLDNYKAEKVFDLIALYEEADALLTTDTMHLHLAAACDIPVISLVGDHAWLASVARSNVVMRVNYSRAMSRFPEITQTIRQHGNHSLR